MSTPGLVPSILPVHILAGILALLFGYVALAATKGATVHRKSGLFFVASMVVLSLTGALVALLNASTISIVAGLLTFYFVTTSLLTVRRRSAETARLDTAAMLFAVAIAMLALPIGVLTLREGRPEAIPMFIFGALGLLAAKGDRQMIRERGIRGNRRIARHLWRMCFAMWVAAASFFWGPPGRVPGIINIPALLPIPVLAPIAVMAIWLWRLRGSRKAHNLVRVDLPGAALTTPEGTRHGAL